MFFFAIEQCICSYFFKNDQLINRSLQLHSFLLLQFLYNIKLFHKLDFAYIYLIFLHLHSCFSFI